MVELDKNRIPRHIAIIMDGNGRWAKAKGLPRTAGHLHGVESVRTITEECTRLGVDYLTLYTFSTENWNRPAAEVQALMDLLFDNLGDEVFMKNNVRFRVVGQLDRLPDYLREKTEGLIRRTASNTATTLVLALSYSGRWEITEACRQICADMQASRNSGKNEWDIDEKLINRYLKTNFMPDPDLLIRTGGELRISNFMLWQMAYTELYFCDTYWPDFGIEALYEAIAEFQARERRYGKTSEQVQTTK